MRRISAVGPWVALIALWDWMFYDHPLGVNLAVFAAALAGVLFLRAGRREPARVVLFLLSLILAGLLAYRSGWLAPVLSVVVLSLLAVTARRGWTDDPEAWVGRGLRLALLDVGRPFRDLALAARARRRRRGPKGGGWGRRLAAWLLPLGLSAVFVVLFRLANPVFERALNRVWAELGRLLDLAWLPSVDRVLLWALVGAVIWTLLRYRGRRRSPREAPPSIPGADGLSPRMVARCLAAFNVVFLLQNLSDAAYLWGGLKLPEGMSYASYAHRGAYPLVATALLAAGFILFAFRPRGAAATHRGVRALVVAWIAQNIVLLASAAWRLHLYVETYCLTRLRLASVVWMALVAFGLATICLRIVRARSNRWLVQVNVVALFLGLLACAGWNPDGFIAWHNVHACREAGGRGAAIDARYLRLLGPEARPALVWLEARPGLPADVGARLRDARERVERQLRLPLHDWRGWTIRRSQLARDLPDPVESPAPVAAPAPPSGFPATIP